MLTETSWLLFFFYARIGGNCRCFVCIFWVNVRFIFVIVTTIKLSNLSDWKNGLCLMEFRCVMNLVRVMLDMGIGN